VAGGWDGVLQGPEGQGSVTIDIIQRYQNAAAVGEVGGDSLLGGCFTGSGRIRGERFSLVLDRPSSKRWASPLRFDLVVLGDSMEGEAREGRKRFVLTAGRSREQLRAAVK
jgi:hypothetical protein